MKVKVGNLTIDVPGPVDPVTVQRAADEVHRRIQAAEEQSSRIDTLGFTLAAALSLAMDLDRARGERDDDAKDMAKALQRIADALESMVEDLSADAVD